jgi:tRNA(Ile2) C34 agmatinyltransferase TiaS
VKSEPKCVFCNASTKATIILRSEGYIVRGWKCPKCGFTLIHPKEIPKALKLLREIAEI